jgi:hypothetical protein
MTVPKLEPGQWWRKPFSMYQTNLREIDANMNVDDVADHIKEYGAAAWLFGVGGIQAQYPTDLRFQMRNPYLSERKSGDLVGDALAAAHSRGLRLLARMDFSKVAPQVAAEHPEWCYMSPNGDLQEHTAGLVSVCPSGGYYQERMFDIIDEICTRYALDGFFFNWMSMNEFDYYKKVHGPCHCSNCQARWLDFSGGLELPKSAHDPTYPQWLVFSAQIIDDVIGRVRGFINDRLPDAGLVLGETADIMFHEANNAVGRELWHHATSQWVSASLSFRPEVPVLVNSTVFMDMPYRMASEEPAHFAQYLLQCISRGGNPSTYTMGVPDRIPYPCLPIGAKITQFHRKWLNIYDGLRPIANTGLVRPTRSQMHATQYDEAIKEFRGLYTAMQEVHVLFDVLPQEHLRGMDENGGLERYSTIVLPDLGKLLPKDATLLDSWVEHGGHLIATGSSGVGDGGLVQLRSFPAERRRAAVTKRELMWSSYIAPPQTSGDPHIYNGPVVPLYGSYFLFDWKKGTQSKYNMLARAPFAPPEKAYGNVQVDHPGAAIGTHGEGKAVVIPWTVGRGYRELGLRAIRDFFLLVLSEEMGAKKDIEVNIAEQVEATVNKNGSKTVIHLLNMSGARTTNFGDHLPIPAGSIKVAGKNVTAHALLADRPLEVVNGEIKLPALDLFEVVVIEGL